eukprot:g7821.t1
MDDAECLKEAGNEHFRQKSYHEAAEFYQQALNAAPIDCVDRAVYHGNKAACFVRLSKFQEALESCNEALKIDKDYIKVLMRRCIIHEHLEQLEEAIKDAERVVELDSEHELAKKTLTRLCKLLNVQQEQRKDEMIGKLKDLGNSVLSKFGVSLDDFKAEKDPETGSYSISFNK